jgi:hypothetical protein
VIGRGPLTDRGGKGVERNPRYKEGGGEVVDHVPLETTTPFGSLLAALFLLSQGR